MREPPVREQPQQTPQKPELERIIEVLAWANEKGALHFKCPYFEILFPQPIDNVNMAPQPVIDDNARAEAGITNPDAVPYKNPIDDPDYYSETQERFYNYQRK